MSETSRIDSFEFSFSAKIDEISAINVLSEELIFPLIISIISCASLKSLTLSEYCGDGIEITTAFITKIAINNNTTAKITSKTDENIAYINDVALNADGTPNSEKWFYPDVNDKKVIARVYPFDEYDNTTYNGYVPRVQVKLTGDKNGVSYQTPSIEWTFRRKVITETENPDGSVTVVIEYNLPVDKSSIPSDWEPIYDEDGATIHKIKRTIKKGEDYDKDVTVKRNGSDDKVTTHVTKKWNLKKIPQAGEPAFVVAIGAIIVIAVVITRRKLSK